MAEPAENPKNEHDPETGEVRDADEAQRRPIVAILNEIRRGNMVDELREAVNEVALAVAEQEKGGSVTLTLKFSPTDYGDNAVSIVDDIKAKVPQPPKDQTLFFTDEEGDLSRKNPRQMDFGDGLREVKPR